GGGPDDPGAGCGLSGRRALSLGASGPARRRLDRHESDRLRAPDHADARARRDRLGADPAVRSRGPLLRHLLRRRLGRVAGLGAGLVARSARADAAARGPLRAGASAVTSRRWPRRAAARAVTARGIAHGMSSAQASRSAPRTRTTL